MRKYITVLLIILSNYVMACPSDRDSIMSTIHRADSCVITNPEKALSIIKGCVPSDSCYEFVKADHTLSLVAIKLRCGIDIAGDSTILKEAIEYYDSKRFRRQQAWGMYFLSTIYRDTGNTAMEFITVDNAVDISQLTGDTVLQNIVVSYRDSIISSVDPPHDIWTMHWDRRLQKEASRISQLETYRSHTHAIIIAMTIILIALSIYMIYYRLSTQNKILGTRLARQKLTNEINRYQQQLLIADMEKELSAANADELYRVIRHHDAVIKRIKEVTAMSERLKIQHSSSIALSKAETDHLVELTDLFHPGFSKRMMQEFPSLTDADMALCAMMLSNMSSTDMALLMGCNLQALKKRKSRLKTDKLRLDYNTEIEEWLRLKADEKIGVDNC